MYSHFDTTHPFTIRKHHTDNASWLLASDLKFYSSLVDASISVPKGFTIREDTMPGWWKSLPDGKGCTLEALAIREWLFRTGCIYTKHGYRCVNIKLVNDITVEALRAAGKSKFAISIARIAMDSEAGINCWTRYRKFEDFSR